MACSPDPAVRNLIEEKNVQDVLITLFVETDNRDWDKVKSCFADEALFDMTSLTGGGSVKMSPRGRSLTGGMQDQKRSRPFIIKSVILEIKLL